MYYLRAYPKYCCLDPAFWDSADTDHSASAAYRTSRQRRCMHPMCSIALLAVGTYT